MGGTKINLNAIDTVLLYLLSALSDSLISW